MSDAAFPAERWSPIGPYGARILHEKEIKCSDAAVLGESDTGAARHVRARATDVAFLLAADAHHHRRVGLLREQRRNRHRDRSVALAAEPAAGELADQHDVGWIDANPASDGGHVERHALRRAVQIQLAVLPVGHRAACFHRVVTRGLHDEAFIEHEIGFRETGFEIAERPFLDGFSHREPARVALVVGEVFCGPLQGLERRRRGRLTRCGWLRRSPDVALAPGAGASRAKTVEWIDDERKRCEVDTDRFDGRCR